jgi:hypothetical protein
MLDMTQSRIYESIDIPLYNFANTFEDGTGLIGVMNNGLMSATVNSSATDNDLFLGVALSTLSTPSTWNNVLAYTIPSSSPYTIVLPQTPNSGQISVTYAANGQAFTKESGAPTAVGEFQLTGATLTFYSGDAGAAIIVVYQYNLTVLEAQTIAGIGLIGNQSPANITANIGVIKKGLIYTSLYDASVNWNATTEVIVGNNGIFTASGGTGAAVDGYVAAAPSVNSPTLGLWINA